MREQVRVLLEEGHAKECFFCREKNELHFWDVFASGPRWVCPEHLNAAIKRMQEADELDEATEPNDSPSWPQHPGELYPKGGCS